MTTPIPPVADVSVADHVQRLRDLPGEVLLEDLTRTFGPELPPWWRAAGEQPTCWLDSCAAAMVDAWPVVSPMWRRAQPLLDREARRVGAAVVRGDTDVLLNTLHPRMRYENGEFWVPAMKESSLDLRGRRLMLVPTVAGPMGRLVSFEMPDVAYIAYPVRGQAELGEHDAAVGEPDRDRLGVLLGRVRADLLRAVRRPLTMGQLATAVGCAARVASYHCGLLEAAGLIVRERRGQSVWVRRTVRGHELIDLLTG